uniref:Triosephosphate isomerase n=1 Tax=Rhodosorus marinus TaxID=101924 RepID=A0A7S2ZFZ3_9RHOD|mmetsp:Transcript_18292/g.73330  ORF Transcript_18292/g.73330 Transcript_18292/m.73330 type:complete len:105 (+) Transcript_18292:134-448(+)
MGRRFMVGGNWKCNGTKESIEALCASLSTLELPSDANVDVMIAPSSLHATMTRSLLPDVYQIGVQNCWTGKGGAFTGESSAEMIKDLVCVILNSMVRFLAWVRS